MRGGKILGKQDLSPPLPSGQDEGEVLAAFLPQFYAGQPTYPRGHTLARSGEEEAGVLEEWLGGGAGRKVSRLVPKREPSAGWSRRSRNARLSLEVHLARQARDLNWISRASNGIYEAWACGVCPPYRVLRHLQPGGRRRGGIDGGLRGRRPCEKGLPPLPHQGVRGQNDVAMIEEVLDRRLANDRHTAAVGRAAVSREGAGLDSFHKVPDLVLVDGEGRNWRRH